MEECRRLEKDLSFDPAQRLPHMDDTFRRALFWRTGSSATGTSWIALITGITPEAMPGMSTIINTRGGTAPVFTAKGTWAVPA